MAKPRMSKQRNAGQAVNNGTGGSFFGASYKPKQYKDFSPQHPINNEANNTKLIEFIKQRLDFANLNRQEMLRRYEIIDRELAGYLIHDFDDAQREKDNVRGKSSKPVDMKLQLVATQMDEMVTYLMSVFAPDSGIFEALANKEKQPIANAFALKLNKDGDRLQYYTNYARGMLNALKYNLGGWTVDYIKLHGKKLKKDMTGTLQKKDDVVWQGNKIEAVDVYNLLIDPSVHPSQVNTFGEFFATVKAHRKFRIMKMEADGEIYGTDKFLNAGEVGFKYYAPKPTIRIDISGQLASGNANGGYIDWTKWLSRGSQSDATKGFEEVNYVGWIVPSQFGLSDSDALEIWRITMMGNNWCVATEMLDNGHCMLPIALTTPVDDDLGPQQKSFAETLIPLQRFASYLFNLHQRSSRKALYGLTFFDPKIIPLNEHTKDDLESAKVPVNLTGTDKPLSNFIHQIMDAPATDKIMNDVSSVIQLMQKMLPTNIQQQLAQLDRATQYQAASVAQGANKRNLKIAKVIEDHAMKAVRFMLMWNTMEKQQTISLLAPDGTEQPFDPSELADTDIEFAMSEGLKGIDKLMLTDNMNELYGKTVTIPGVAEQIDLIGLLNYIGTLMGDKTDLTQFRKDTGVTQLPPDVQSQVMQLHQSGELENLFKSNTFVKKQQQKAAGQIAAQLTNTDQNLPDKPPAVPLPPGAGQVQQPVLPPGADQQQGPQMPPVNGPLQ